MDCIGAFSEILYSHPNILSHILPLVTSSIRNPEISLCATMALKVRKLDQKLNLILVDPVQVGS